jgi:hypothetical protein
MGLGASTATFDAEYGDIGSPLNQYFCDPSDVLAFGATV